jgi:hypothetical protein
MMLAPTQPQRVYLGLKGLGVWRTDDRGDNWAKASLGLPMDVQVLSLDVSASDPDVVFAGSA